MKVGYCNSTNKMHCKVCNKLTSDYKTFTQSDMRIELPICEEHFNDNDSPLMMIQLKSEIFLKEINKLFKG